MVAILRMTHARADRLGGNLVGRLKPYMSASTWTGSLPSCAGMACCTGMQTFDINTEAHKKV
jgi:hypothetical protein